MDSLNELFGGAFDLNGDGHTDFAEEYLAFQFFEDAERQRKKELGLILDDDDDSIF